MAAPLCGAALNSYTQSLYLIASRILANIAMLAAVFVGMYEASRWPGWPSEAVFCLFFFGITIPAWTLAWLFARWIRRHWAATRTLVSLPGLGSQPVAWSVRDGVCPDGPRRAAR